MGNPLQTEPSTSNNTMGSQSVSRKNNFAASTKSYYDQARYPKKAFSAATVKNEESQGMDPIDEMLRSLKNHNEFLRAFAEHNDLLRRLSTSSQQSTINGDILIWSFVLSFSNSKSNKNLHAGYRVRVCNTCLSGNSLELIPPDSIEFETLTKVHHMCEQGNLTSSTLQESVRDNPNIREAQNNLFTTLTNVVDIRIGHQEGEVSICLRAQEVFKREHQLLLQSLGNKRLPENRSWIEEEDYIELDDIDCNNNIEKEKQWPYRIIKEEGRHKVIKISKNELTDFLNIAKGTFGAFSIKIDDEVKRYFIISIVF